MIKINDNIFLETFDNTNNEHLKIYKEFQTNSKSDMINEVEQRLVLSRSVDNLEYANSYLIKYENNIVGYLYLTAKSKKDSYIYLEMSILKEFRGKHLGRMLLEEITNYIYEKNTDLREIRFSIDRSNTASMVASEAAGFYPDDDDYLNKKIDFIKNNPYYIEKTRK